MALETEIDDTFTSVVRISGNRVLITGGPGVGKTYTLAKIIGSLIENDVAPGEICAVVSTSSAAQVFESLLERVCPGLSSEIWVGTARELFVKILSSDKAIEATGRVPRILSDFETKFLLEDMKTLGEPNKRLSEMLKFFYRQWTELGDEDPNWLVSVEEKLVVDALQRHLTSRHAMLESELANIAAKYIGSHDEAISALGKPYVIVDDYQNLSKASQVALGLLGRNYLVVAGNENERIQSIESFPYPEGIDAFRAYYPDVYEVHLSVGSRSAQGITAAGNALILNSSKMENTVVSMQESMHSGFVKVVKWNTPSDEFKGIAYYLKRRLSNEDDSLNFEDVFIAVPNKTWGKNIIKQLNALQIKTSDVITRQPLCGDPRKLSSSYDLRMYTALNLVAHPRDAVAWRSWCGFGDHLTNSIAWARLEVYANERGIDIIDALEEIALADDRSINDVVILTDCFKSGSKIIQRCEGKRGFALLGLLAETGKDFSSDVEKLIGRIEGDEDAKELYEKASTQLLDPAYRTNGSVKVGLYESMCGLEAHLVILAGTIDGFIPSGRAFDTTSVSHKRDAIKEDERILFYSALTKATDELIISYFQKEDLEVAESLKMEVRRVRAEHGRRVALVSPSCYIDEMGDALPGPLAGDCIDS